MKSKVIGSVLLITGSCIGAAILGLPTHTAEAGFIPSAMMFILCCAFMLSTGLLLAEVNLGCAKGGNLISMANKTLGGFAKVFVALLFCFLFYSIMLAYSSGSGVILKEFFFYTTGIYLSSSFSSFLFTLFTAAFVVVGTGACDRLNRLFMFGLAATYVAIVVVCVDDIDLSLLSYKRPSAMLLTAPVMIVSFGYHNLVPSLTDYLESKPKPIFWAITFGCALPLLIYLLWIAVVLGLVSPEQFAAAKDDGGLITQALGNADFTGGIFQIMQAFSFFAIVTSFLGVALSFADFITDGLRLKKNVPQRMLATVLALAPPYLLSLGNPKLFLRALDVAGGFGASILFGVVPVLMVIVGRRKKMWEGEMIPGGFPMLIAVMLFAFAIFGIELVRSAYEILGGG